MTVYFGIFKEPRGFIRFLQFIFAIFAFATACNGGSNLSVTDGSNNLVISASWSYPYSLQDTQILTKLSNTSVYLSASNDVKPSAEFFVFTGVTSMLLSLGFLVLYIFMDRLYRNDERFPIIDFVITLIWTIFWIASSSAWAQGVSNIRSVTSIDYLTNQLGCTSGTPPCVNTDSGTYANVTVSVIFGFLNFFLWLACIWFVYKETKFFKSRTAHQQPPPQNNFSNIAPPNPYQPGIPGNMG